MFISNLNWKHIEEYLKNDDRCILPIGSTEQHAYLSLSTDAILAERIAREAAEPLNIPVFPVVNYGVTPAFMAFPGTITLRLDTLNAIVRDILESMVHHGFKRIFMVNGHGGNMPVSLFIKEWEKENPEIRVKFHNWWNSPLTMAKVGSFDPIASHASWMENFPWTRLKDVVQPVEQKPLIDSTILRTLTPEKVRATIGDGSYGGYYQRKDIEMYEIWETAVEETRAWILEE